jgi:hypothetical protein
MPSQHGSGVEAAPVERVFAPLRDLPCWNVTRGHGSFLTFEFGAPHLTVREPMETSPEMSSRVRQGLARRFVSLRGDWHLWIYCCLWQVRDRRKVIGDWTSKRRMDRAAAYLDGQKLISVDIARRGVRTVFEFDLGGRLETAPYDRNREQWLLYEPAGTVFTVKAGRYYQHQRGNFPYGAGEWIKF